MEILGQPEQWLALCLLAVLVLGVAIRSLMRALRASVVASLPLQVEQTIELPATGTYDLYVEGTRFSADFRHLAFELHGAGGAPVPVRPALFRFLVAGLKRVRLKLAGFAAPAPGSYLLRLTGIRPDQDPANRIVVATPVAAKVAAHVLAIVALSALSVGSLVIALLMQSPLL
jgi:hypothetical protein